MFYRSVSRKSSSSILYHREPSIDINLAWYIKQYFSRKSSSSILYHREPSIDINLAWYIKQY